MPDQTMPEQSRPRSTNSSPPEGTPAAVAADVAAGVSADAPFVAPSVAEALARLAKLYRPLYRAFSPFERWSARNDPARLRTMKPGAWQAENFEDLPVFVIPCYTRNLRHRPVGRPQISVASFYGSVYPAVQNLLLSCRAVGLGASLQTLPIWCVPIARRILGLPRTMNPVCVIPIGWARGKYGPTTRRPIGEVVHLDSFGNQPYAATYHGAHHE